MNKRNSFKVFHDGKGKNFFCFTTFQVSNTNVILFKAVDYNKRRPPQHGQRKPLQSKPKLENVRRRKKTENGKRSVPQILEQEEENDRNPLSAREEEFLIDYLKSIFPDKEVSEEPNPNFKATSTPFSSQIELDASRDVVLNQEDLDFEINKIHESINRNRLPERPRARSIRKHSDSYHRHGEPQIYAEVTDVHKKPLPEKGNSKKGKGKRGMGGKEKLTKSRHQDPNINHDSITYMTKPNTFVIAKDKNQLNKTRATKQNVKPPTNAKKELSYGDIMRMCQKGKDPIDLLF